MIMKKRIWILGAAALMTASLSACGTQKETTGEMETATETAKETAAAMETEEGASFSNFTAVTLDGDTVTEEIFQDYDLTMINIWGTFCGPCLSEMPDLGEISEEYQDKGVQVVGIVTDVLNRDGSLSQEQLDTAREIVEKTGADYIHLLPSGDLIEAKLSQVTAVPETVFVDSEGNLVGESHLGAKTKEDWKGIIDEYLEY